MSNPNWFRHEWVWRKNKATGHLNASHSPLKAHENVLVFCEKKPRYYPQKTQGHRPVNAFYTRANGSNYGHGAEAGGGGSTERYPTSVLDIPVINNDDPQKFHPTQKPVALMSHLVLSYTKPGDVVLDFSMGSGTTGEACLIAGRIFIGIDDDAHMAQKTAERLSRYGAVLWC